MRKSGSLLAVCIVTVLLPGRIPAQEDTVVYAIEEKMGLFSDPAGERVADVHRSAEMRVRERKDGWARVELTGWVPERALVGDRERAGESGQLRDIPVELVRYRIQKMSKDLHRRKKPYGAHVRIYFQFRNRSKKTLTGLEYTAEYLDSFGELLHEETYRHQLKLDPGKVNPREHFWYYEDNEFIDHEPYDLMRAAADAETMKIRVVIRKAVFSDGSVIDVSPEGSP